MSKKFVSMCLVMLMAFNLFSSAAAYDIHGIQDNSAVKEIAEIMMDEDAFVQSLNEVAVSDVCEVSSRTLMKCKRQRLGACSSQKMLSWSIRGL